MLFKFKNCPDALISIALILAIPLYFTSCRQSAVRSAKEVSVSIVPQKYIAERIAGKLFNISVLMPPGSNHETYEPTPKVMKSLAGCSIYFSVGGLDFERTWMPRFTEMYPDMKIVNTSEGRHLIESSEHRHGSNNGGADPHTWLSPRDVKIQASIIAAAFIKQDPEHKAVFAANLIRFTAQLDSLDSAYTKLFASRKGMKFLIYHPSLGYFARDYDLTQVSLETDGKEPSAAHLARLIEMSEKEKIHTILISREFDSRNAETLASEINGRVMIFDPMAADWMSNMDRISKILAGNE
jgi:zinc transport system substrate-binding protein